ncbi:hypothetical protein [Azovibrio restrictus]|uniref:DUF6891 domain-containing protein n=1 Tax=Azovibrio restrictus TaxID=146938 RepID=UPI0026E9E2AA|nr:hypothetical protein [Azovibrio restrictus]MDD3482317.1 hypothetical protein [Azovibrio restrictus]
MSETEIYILESIKKWVWSGYYQPDHVCEMLCDILEEDVDENVMRQAIDIEFSKKAEEEKSWPPVTDCDRLDSVFVRLDKAGICACQNAGYTMSDGYSDVAEALAYRGKENYHGYCFFHGQDIERALEGHGLSIAFGDLNDVAEKTISVGQSVKHALEEAGFEVEWNGSADSRLNVPKINWQRRY